MSLLLLRLMRRSSLVALAAFCTSLALMALILWQMEVRRQDSLRTTLLSLATDQAQSVRSRLDRLLSTTYLLAAVVSGFVVPLWGWRALFVIAAVPALLVLPIRYGVPESFDREKALAERRARASLGRTDPVLLTRLAWGSLVMACNFGGYYGLTSLYPVLLEAGDGQTPESGLRAVKETLRRIPRRGLGFGVLRYLSKDEALAARLRALPAAEVSFNYLGQLDHVVPGVAVGRQLEHLFAVSLGSFGVLRGSS